MSAAAPGACVQMEDLTCQYMQPCVIDLKMGFKTSYKGCPHDKMLSYWCARQRPVDGGVLRVGDTARARESAASLVVRTTELMNLRSGTRRSRVYPGSMERLELPLHLASRWFVLRAGGS